MATESKPGDQGGSQINLDRVLNATRNEPVFSKARYESMLPIWERIKVCGGTYTTIDLFGNEGTSTIKPDPMNYHDAQVAYKIAMGYRSYHHMADEDLDLDEYVRKAIDTTRFRPFVITHIRYGDDHDCEKDEHLEENLQRWGEYWMRSQFRENLIRHLQEHVDEMVEVKQVVCFGLGSLGRNAGCGPYGPRTYLQHLAACTIRDTLEAEYAKQNDTHAPRTIALYTQEPTYCLTCAKVLEGKHRMEVVENPYGFSKIDRNTFVMTIAPDIPVRQIVSDLTLEYDGPAGMLCDEIKTDGMELNGPYVIDHKLGYRVSPYTTDPSSPNLAAYRDRCLALCLNDADLPGQEQAFSNTALYLKKR